MANYDLYRAAVAADELWMNEVKQQFPRQWPGDVRYTKASHGTPGSKLRFLFIRWKELSAAWMDSICR